MTEHMFGKEIMGCEYRFGIECKDTNELNTNREERYEDLMEQFNELCTTPSFENCSHYKYLNEMNKIAGGIN